MHSHVHHSYVHIYMHVYRHLCIFLTPDGSGVDVRVLGGGVVAPDDAADYVLDVGTRLECELAHGAVVVKAGERGEVLCVMNKYTYNTHLVQRMIAHSSYTFY